MDLSTNTIRWAKVMTQKESLVVTGLALNPDSTSVAAYLMNCSDTGPSQCGNDGWLTVLNTQDGGPSTLLKGNKNVS